MEENVLNNPTVPSITPQEHELINNEKKDEIPYDSTKESVEDYMKNNKSMYDNYGKYFDSYLFNAKFKDYIKKEDKHRLLEGKLNTNDLDKIANTKIEPYELPINKIIINIKDMWFNMFDNIMDMNNPFDNFTNEKIFYFGISLIVISLLYLFLYVIFY